MPRHMKSLEAVMIHPPPLLTAFRAHTYHATPTSTQGPMMQGPVMPGPMMPSFQPYMPPGAVPGPNFPRPMMGPQMGMGVAGPWMPMPTQPGLPQHNYPSEEQIGGWVCFFVCVYLYQCHPPSINTMSKLNNSKSNYVIMPVWFIHGLSPGGVLAYHGPFFFCPMHAAQINAANQAQEKKGICGSPYSLRVRDLSLFRFGVACDFLVYRTMCS